MQITDELLDKVANLCRLSFQGEEKAVIRHDFQRMLDFVSQLQEVDTTDIEPLIHMTEEENRFRADEPSGVIDRKQALKNAPHHDHTYFLVPKVVDKQSES